MTSSVPPEPNTPPRQAPVPQTLADWFQVNTRYIAIGAAVIAAAAIGWWFYTENRERVAAKAESDLMKARQTFAVGNTQLAEGDLKKIVESAGNTRAGVEAALLLAESMLTRGAYAEAIDVLDDFKARGSAEVVRSKVYSLIGDAHMELNKPAEAAGAYASAAEASRFVGERASQLAKRARALGAAGDTAKARQQWEELVEMEEAPGVAAEARVRLGELTAAPVRQG